MQSMHWILFTCLYFSESIFYICAAESEYEQEFNGECGQLYKVPGQDIKFPWVATVRRKGDTKDDIPAAILSPSLLIMNANHFYKDELKLLFQNFSMYSASVNLTRLGDTNLENPPYTQTVEVSHIRLHPDLVLKKSRPYYINDFALIHLKTELKFDHQVHAVCVPTAELADKILKSSSSDDELSETNILISGWKRFSPENICQRLKVNNEEYCNNYWRNHNETKEADYVNRFCANVSQGYTHEKCINQDNGVFGTFTTLGVIQETAKYYYLGVVNDFYSHNRNCNNLAIIFVNEATESTLKLIENNKLCGPMNFTCDSGQCVSLDSICNYKTECQDGSDENILYCDAILHRYCKEKEEFQCNNGNRTCISNTLVCNGIQDCPGGDDENTSLCKKDTPLSHPSNIAIPVTIGVLALMISIAICAALAKKLHELLRETNDLSDKEVEEFQNGMKAHDPNYGSIESEVSVAETTITVDGNENIRNSAHALPFDTGNFEIPREKLNIEWDRVLGKGRFAIVYKAVYDCEDSCYDVAVKTFKPCGCKSDFMSQLDELKMMSRIGRHKNIVNLVGAFTKHIQKRILYIVVELCQLGNLQAFLMQNEERFIDVIDRDGSFNPSKSQRLKKGPPVQYENVAHINETYQKPFTTLDLLLWAYQIASGMEYLASKNVSHGDLAARNILLTENYTAKIGDFGLSCYLDNTGAYKRKGKKTPLPWKWMAIESLQDLKFSTESDVWSYGVTLWEIFTLGKTPYPGLANENICDELVNKGTRLGVPDFASEEIFTKMQQCWSSYPCQRPTFSSLHTYFQGLYQCLDYVIVHDL